MFSRIIMLSSTTRPTARVSPSMVKVFRVNPKNFIPINVAIIAVGMERIILKAAPSEPKKIQTTNAVRTPERIRVNFNSCIESSIKVVPSKFTPIEVPSGREAAINFILSFTRCATSTALEPRFFRKPRPIELSPITRLILRTSSRPSSTDATCFNDIGE